MGMSVISSGFPAEVSADISKQVVAASSIASTAKGIKHGKVTLSLPKVMYDGNRLDITVRQEGGTVDHTKFPVLHVDGKKMEFSVSSIMTMGNENITIISYPTTGEQKLPDQFDMKLKIHAKNVKEPFVFEVPVKKLDTLVKLQPSTTKKSGDFSYTVHNFEMTPLMTKLTVNSKGKVPAAANGTGEPSKMFYDIADEKGNVIQADLSDLDIKKKPGKTNKEMLQYSSFKTVPKTITNNLHPAAHVHVSSSSSYCQLSNLLISCCHALLMGFIFCNRGRHFPSNEGRFLCVICFLMDMHEAAKGTKRFRTSGSGRLKAFQRKAHIGSICLVI